MTSVTNSKMPIKMPTKQIGQAPKLNTANAAVNAKPALSLEDAAEAAARGVPSKVIEKLKAGHPLAGVAGIDGKPKLNVISKGTSPTPKTPKEEKVYEIHPRTGWAMRNPRSFRWVCTQAVENTWPESGDVADFSQEAATEECKSLYAKAGGTSEFTDEVWAKQCDIMRAWLRRPDMDKPLPGDERKPSTKTPEQRTAMLDRLAKGRAVRAALAKGKAKAPKDEDVGEEPTEE